MLAPLHFQAIGFIFVLTLALVHGYPTPRHSGGLIGVDIPSRNKGIETHFVVTKKREERKQSGYVANGHTPDLEEKPGGLSNGHTKTREETDEESSLLAQNESRLDEAGSSTGRNSIGAGGSSSSGAGIGGTSVAGSGTGGGGTGGAATGGAGTGGASTGGAIDIEKRSNRAPRRYRRVLPEKPIRDGGTSASTGGASTGGASTGGAATGGVSTGGSGTGGGGVGGVARGGAAAGGNSAGGASSSVSSFQATILRPYLLTLPDWAC